MATSTYLTNFPVVLKEFHPEKNTGITSSKVTVGSRTKIWWRCKLGHEWQATPNARLGRRDKGVIQGCPYCSGRLASPENNLLVCYPEIAAELDEQNGLILQYMISLQELNYQIYAQFVHQLN